MDFGQAKQYLAEARNTLGMELGLERMQRLMEALGNPQDKVKFIHIAGTNGKGSVAAYLSRILCCAGFCTGKYTSPAVFDFREQYVVNETMITEDEIAKTVTRVAAAADLVETEQQEGTETKHWGRPTWFEQETALAFLWFAEKGCEFAVLEAGLGGDEDATNIVGTTVCSILTSISLDHTRILGNTLEEIAGHKAGILRPGVPVVSWRQKEEAMSVIREQADRLGSPLFVADPQALNYQLGDRHGMTVSYRESGKLYTKQRAVWQAENIAVVLEAVYALRMQGYVIEDRAVAEGIAQMYWPGRFEIVEGTPGLILDGAHNPAGAAALRRSLDENFLRDEKVFVMGVLADKDYRKVAEILLKNESCVFTVASDSPRALPAKQLAEEIHAIYPEIRVQAADSVAQAIGRAREILRNKGGPENKSWIVVCGSLSFMKEVGHLREQRQDRLRSYDTQQRTGGYDR